MRQSYHQAAEAGTRFIRAAGAGSPRRKLGQQAGNIPWLQRPIP